MPDESQISPTESATPQGGPDVLTGLQRLLERQSGDAGRVAELLYRENYDLRERARQLASQIPAQGAVVLDHAQAAHWQAYTALGEPSALQQALDARQQAEQRLASLEREATLRQIAEASGYRPSVLGRLAEGLTLELRENQPVVVTGEGAQAQVTPLAEYAQREWADFLPALAQTTGTGSGSGTTFVRQPASSGGQGTDLLTSFIDQRNAERDKAPNPLRRV